MSPGVPKVKPLDMDTFLDSRFL